jgi:hypothetical protein
MADDIFCLTDRGVNITVPACASGFINKEVLFKTCDPYNVTAPDPNATTVDVCFGGFFFSARQYPVNECTRDYLSANSYYYGSIKCYYAGYYTLLGLASFIGLMFFIEFVRALFLDVMRCVKWLEEKWKAKATREAANEDIPNRETVVDLQ